MQPHHVETNKMPSLNYDWIASRVYSIPRHTHTVHALNLKCDHPRLRHHLTLPLSLSSSCPNLALRTKHRSATRPDSWSVQFAAPLVYFCFNRPFSVAVRAPLAHVSTPVSLLSSRVLLIRAGKMRSFVPFMTATEESLGFQLSKQAVWRHHFQFWVIVLSIFENLLTFYRFKY